LLGPDLDAGVIQDVEQRLHVGRLEAPAEIASSGRIRDAAGAPGIEENLVIAAPLDVLQTGAVTQGGVGEVEEGTGLRKRQGDLGPVQARVDGVDQADVPGQGMDGADAAVGHAAAAVGDLMVDVAGREHRLAASTELSFVQAPLQAALVVVQFSSYRSMHSKSLLASRVQESSILS